METETIQQDDIRSRLETAIELHRQGELSKAGREYEAILAIDPDHADANHLLGVVSGQLGNTEQAIQYVEASLRTDPEQPSALNNLGNLFAEADRLDDAIETYRRAITLQPAYAQAFHNLGNVLGDSGQVAEAVSAFKTATELQPDDVASRLALGSAAERVGDFDLAAESFREVLVVDEASIAALNRLGAVLRKSGDLAEAKRAYERWLELEPENPVANHFHAVCDSDDAVPERASAEYVKATFDGFAEEFDECLAELQYTVPEQLGALVTKWLPEPNRDLDVIDLGCGTGLCGQYLRKYAKQLIGIDLSPAMLEKADATQYYDELVETELTAYLSLCVGDQDLLVSADTLIYVGDLRSTFEAAHQALRPGGHLVFSLEQWTESEDARSSNTDGFRLNASGRYVHTEDCVRSWLADADFKIMEWTDAKLREEGNTPTMGFLIVATKGISE